MGFFSTETVFKEKCPIFPGNKFNKHLIYLGACNVQRKRAISVLSSKGVPGEAAVITKGSLLIETLRPGCLGTEGAR